MTKPTNLKKEVLDLFYDYAKKVEFINDDRKYEMSVIDEIFFEELIEKILNNV